jgi:hypothetical protein
VCLGQGASGAHAQHRASPRWGSPLNHPGLRCVITGAYAYGGAHMCTATARRQCLLPSEITAQVWGEPTHKDTMLQVKISK